MSLTEKMVRYRAKNGLSMKKSAELAGVTTQTWQHVERGIQKPSRLTEYKIKLLIGDGADES